jgi:hypothetical protein
MPYKLLNSLAVLPKFPTLWIREIKRQIRELTGNIWPARVRKRGGDAHLFWGARSRSFLVAIFGREEIEMVEHPAPRARYGEVFWRAHHEARKRSDLNQREFCEAEGLSLKAFGNWRAMFKAEPHNHRSGSCSTAAVGQVTA